MVGWQICCMRSNMIWWQTPDWLRGIPWCCTAFPDTQYPPWLPAPSNHSASDSKADSWEAGFWEDHLHCGVPPPKAPHPLCKGTNPSFAPQICSFMLSPTSPWHHPTPNSFTLVLHVSLISHKYSRNGAGLWEQTSTAPPWLKQKLWMAPSIFVWQGVYKPFDFIWNNLVSQPSHLDGIIN